MVKVMAALEAESDTIRYLDTIDISKYETVYVSYGSKNHSHGAKQHRFNQSNPPFLSFFGPYLCIAIDPDFSELDSEVHTDKDEEYPDFEFVTIPVETLSDIEAMQLSESHPKKTVFDFKREYSIKKTEEITQKIVQLLKPEQRVFFVNFIKFVDTRAHDARIGELLDIEQHLGPFKKDYYEWAGYLYPNIIVKKHSTKIRTTVLLDIASLIGSTTIYNGYQEKFPSTVLERMYDDISNKRFRFKYISDIETAHKALLQCVIDITGRSDLFTTQVDIMVNDPGPDKPAGGTRRRRRRRKTRR